MDIQEARKNLFENAGEGGTCPCCNQFVKFYRRSITSAMALSLILLMKKARQKGDDWVHVEEIVAGTKYPTSVIADIAKLRYWDLIEPYVGEREDGSKRTGYWKLTLRGSMFVNGQTGVVQYVVLYNGKAIKYEGPLIFIRDTLKNKFNYEELMGEFKITRNKKNQPVKGQVSFI